MPSTSPNYMVWKDKKYCFVVEMTTNQVVLRTKNGKRANAVRRHLNAGGGFDGNTPPFFVRKIDQACRFSSI